MVEGYSLEKFNEKNDRPVKTVISQSSEPLSTVDSLSFNTSPIPQLDEQMPQLDGQTPQLDEQIPDDDDHVKVRNVELRVSQNQDGSLNYKPSLASYIKRHVNNYF